MQMARAFRIGLVLLLFLAALPAHSFDLQAHRGGRGLRPENTLASFENAIRLGTTTLEMDIAITADGVPVISHDPALNPAFTRDAQGRWLTQNGPLITSLTLSQLKTYDVGRLNPSLKYGRDFPEQQPRDGERIPTLAEVFKMANDMGATDIQFDIETKIDPHHPDDTLAPEAFVDVLLKAIRKAGMTKRSGIESFDWRTLELLHKLQPDLRTVYLSMDFPSNSTLKGGVWTAGHLLNDFGGSVPRLVRASAGQARGIIWSPNFNNLNAALVKEAHALEMQVIPWTVNDQTQMERLIDCGVDGIITDYPNRLREVMAAKGMPLPQSVNPGS